VRWHVLAAPLHVQKRRVATSRRTKCASHKIYAHPHALLLPAVVSVPNPPNDPLGPCCTRFRCSKQFHHNEHGKLLVCLYRNSKLKRSEIYFSCRPFRVQHAQTNVFHKGKSRVPTHILLTFTDAQETYEDNTGLKSPVICANTTNIKNTVGCAPLSHDVRISLTFGLQRTHNSLTPTQRPARQC
jgi:hypothetical protein